MAGKPRNNALLRQRVVAVGMAIAATLFSSMVEAEDGDASAAKAPVKRIVLFTSGVGYFERRGTVNGDAAIELKFNVGDVNDLLKSMVLEDLDGGRISTVTYGSRDPLTKTLKTFAIDLTQSPTLGQLLSQIRGQQVEITSPTKTSGVIVGVEKQQEKLESGGVIETELLTVLTDEGLRRIPLEAIGRIEIGDPELQKEFRDALAVLAASNDADKKSVTLHFRGEGERNVRVGYIQEAPVWKTSYRLVLDENEKPFLQGWAIVENTTDDDWQDVQLSLVSGRPISFVMDLYSPLYADRPVVTPELYSSLRPQMYDQDMSAEQLAVRTRLLRNREARTQEVPAAAPALAARSSTATSSDDGVAFGAAAEGAVPKSGEFYGFERFQQTVGSTAQAAEVGELFKYDIDMPVTISRQTSAMLPIINDSVEGEKVSIYNAQVHAKHPLDGFRLKNSSDLHLMQGPMTVFDGGVYAGDARLPDLAPGAERLLSYALDLDIEVAATSDATPQDLVSVKIDKGVLSAAYKQRRTQSYTLKNSGGEAETVLVEHPIQQGWDLSQPKEPTEKTRDEYRFAVEVTPDESAELKIVEEQTIRQTFAIASQADNQLQYFLNAKDVSEEVKESLREVVNRRSELAGLTRQQEQVTQQIASIADEQSRLRQNMQAIDRNTDLYTRYVQKLSSQEDQIEKLRDELKRVEDQISEKQKSLDEYLSNLTLE